ncbi:MAG: hypothetical protein ACRCZP_11585 [Phycicoccus sp.]
MRDARTSWGLFADWCDAHGRTALPASGDTVEAFIAGCPAAEGTIANRLVVIWRVHEQRGYDTAPFGHVLDRGERFLWRIGPQWLILQDALAAVDVTSWPSGFRGRRDAALLAVASHVPVTRAELVALPASAVSVVQWASHTVVRVADVEIWSHDDPASCASCAVVRWMRTAWIGQDRSRGAVREEMLSRRTGSGHECRRVAGVEGWSGLWQVWPAIDRHGWVTDWRPMSPRAVSAVLAARQAPDALHRLRNKPPPIAQPDDDRDVAVVQRRARFAETSTDDLLARLDEEAAAADEVLQRVTAALR